MLKPICYPCQRFFRPKKNGLYFIEGMPKTGQATPGTTDPDSWRPYKLWAGDLWECEGCGAEIIAGTGNSPIALQHEPDFKQRVEQFGADYQVNDC